MTLELDDRDLRLLQQAISELAAPLLSGSAGAEQRRDGSAVAQLLATRRAAASLALQRVLLPVVRAGADARRRVRSAGEHLSATLEAVGIPVGLYAPDGGRLHGNRAMRAVLSEEDSAEAVRHEMGVCVQAATESTEDAVAGAGSALRTVTVAGRVYRIRAAVIDVPTVGSGECVLVTVTMPRLPDDGTIVERLGLTPRQAEVALLVARGRSDKRVAAELEISVHTARRHVSAVLRRLGLHSRRDVRDRLLGGPVPDGEGRDGGQTDRPTAGSG